MTRESYAKSIERVVEENNLTKCHLDTLKRLVFQHRKENNLLNDDDYEYLETREPHKKGEHRIHGGLQSLKRKNKAKFLGDNEYQFVI